MENEKDAVDRRLRELEDELAQIGRGNERQENDITELKRKHASEIDRLKSEISALHDKHLSDLDDEKEQYGKAVENLKLIEDELRDKIHSLEKQLAESLNRLVLFTCQSWYLIMLYIIMLYFQRERIGKREERLR